MSTICPDISREILLRVSIKSLARFRLVSKSWQNLIDDILSEQPSRILVWPKLSSGKNKILQSIEHGATADIPIPEIFEEWDSTHIRPVGSLNGLICIVTTCPNDIIVWNPLTQVYTKLPRLHMSQSMHCYPNLGYDVSSGDYKVVLLTEDMNICACPERYRCLVYSPKKDVWSSLELPWYVYQFYPLEKNTQIFLNGSLHWIVRRKLDAFDDEGRRFYGMAILAFELAEEKFWTIQLPNCAGYPFLAVLDGQLCLYFDHGFNTELWVMEEYGAEKSWVPWFSVAGVPDLRPLCMSREKKIVAVVNENRLNRELVIYDPMQRRLQKIKLQDNLWSFVIAYGESFISPSVFGSSS